MELELLHMFIVFGEGMFNVAGLTYKIRILTITYLPSMIINQRQIQIFPIRSLKMIIVSITRWNFEKQMDITVIPKSIISDLTFLLRLEHVEFY
jgi:hypothetical protein